MAVVILVIAGLYLGSLTNLVAGRLGAGRPSFGSMVWGRSSCVHCAHELAPWDLVPVLSWLWLRGRCRYCGGRIDDSPIVEAAMPALFVVSYVVWPIRLSGLGLATFLVWLAFVAFVVGLVTYALRRRSRRIT